MIRRARTELLILCRLLGPSYDDWRRVRVDGLRVEHELADAFTVAWRPGAGAWLPSDVCPEGGRPRWADVVPVRRVEHQVLVFMSGCGTGTTHSSMPGVS